MSPPVTDRFDLAGLRLTPGEGRRLELGVELESLVLGEEPYSADPATVDAVLEVSRMLGNGYALRLRFAASLEGPCMRCLKPAHPTFEIDAREVDRPDSGDELASPYLAEEILDLKSWARDAFVLAVPVKVVCRDACLGLCPVCAVDLNEASPEHQHERAGDPRWAKLRELKLD
jgi:uncharacterized protein